MKHSLIAMIGLCATTLPLPAEILNLDFSPDSATPGLAPANEVPPVTGTGSGDEILSGITFDTVSNMLSIPFAYGSFGGFANLSGPATAAHLHGPAPVTGTAPPIFDFFTVGQHFFGPVPANGGAVIGSTVLSPANETSLLAGQLYVNVHTAANPNGEVRGQLVVVTNDAPTVTCPLPSEVECESHDDTQVELVAAVADADGDALLVIFTLDGVAQPEIQVPSGGATTAQDVSFNTALALGEHSVSVAVSDGTGVAVSCDFTVTVVDTTAPEIISIDASPKTLWPPNGKMKTVNLDIEAEDACGEVTTEIISVTSSDGGTGDFAIVDEDTVQLRAKRAGGGNGRVYTITVEATDESGNSSTDTVEVTVAHDKGKKGNK